MRYLGYAIGEVILIIVGILFALKINDWNEDRKAQAEFDEYIVQLKVDVEQVIQRNIAVSEYTKIQAMRANSIIGYLDQGDLSEEDIEQLEYSLNRLAFYREIQIEVGLVGEILDSKTEVISRDPDFYNRTMWFLSGVKVRANVRENKERNSRISFALLFHNTVYGGVVLQQPEFTKVCFES